MIQFMLVIIVSFLGIFAGILLSFIAPEELKPGKKYLWFFQHAMAILILIFFFAFQRFDFWHMVIYGILFLLLMYYCHITDIEFEFHRFLFVASAVILFLSYDLQNWFVLEGAAIFLYGLPTASLYVLSNIKLKKSQILLGALRNYSFFVVLALLLVIFT